MLSYTDAPPSYSVVTGSPETSWTDNDLSTVPEQDLLADEETNVRAVIPSTGRRARY